MGGSVPTKRITWAVVGVASILSVLLALRHIKNESCAHHVAAIEPVPAIDPVPAINPVDMVDNAPIIKGSPGTIEFWQQQFVTSLGNAIIASGKYEKFLTKSEPPHYMYLRPAEAQERVSNGIRHHGFWPDCNHHSIVLKQILDNPERPRIVVDIGGNIGGCTLFYAAFGFQIYTFEPVSTNLGLLSAGIVENIKAKVFDASSIFLVPAGAGTEEDRRTIFIEHKNAGNSVIFEPGHKGSKENFDSEDISIVRMDDVVTQRVSFMKLDCQGFELHALRGATELLKNHGVDQMYMEFGPNWLKDTGTKPVQLLEFLDHWGYMIYHKPNYNKTSEGFATVHLPRQDFTMFAESLNTFLHDYTDIMVFSTKVFPNLPSDISYMYT